ncbi:MAG: hypothetical protein JXA58_04555 [Dehalococcoidia bacterium]|nr:hypothetical protein [Dehalococcoidia bacterium]
MWKLSVSVSVPFGLTALLEDVFRHRSHPEPVLRQMSVSGDIGPLTRWLCQVPALFAAARAATGFETALLATLAAGEVPTVLARIECERRAREETILPLAKALADCHSSLESCAVTPSCRRRLQAGLSMLDTEYVRLRDAETFFFARRSRQVRSGEADDDPEFTVILERAIYATTQDDDVAESVSKTVQSMVVALLPDAQDPLS